MKKAVSDAWGNLFALEALQKSNLFELKIAFQEDCFPGLVMFPLCIGPTISQFYDQRFGQTVWHSDRDLQTANCFAVSRCTEMSLQAPIYVKHVGQSPESR